MIITLNGRAETIDDVKDLCYCIGLCTSQDNAKELENSIEVLLDAEMNMDFGNKNSDSFRILPYLCYQCIFIMEIENTLQNTTI